MRDAVLSRHAAEEADPERIDALFRKCGKIVIPLTVLNEQIARQLA